MTFKVLELTIDLLTAVSAKDWSKANELVDEVKELLVTYKYSC